jgi:hypothetical protein
MNSYTKFILLLTVAILCSCIQEDFYDTISNDNPSEIEVSAKLIKYSQNTVGTKADGGSFNPNTFEDTIYNAFFMLFDNKGVLRILDEATVNSEESTVSYSAQKNILYSYPNATICFLANITSESISTFSVNKTTWEDIDNFYLNVNYASSSSTRCIGVPEATDLNGDGTVEYGLPMFGSNIMTSNNSNEPIDLVRLLARVEIYMSLGIEDNGSITTLTSQPQFGLDLCEIYNIPKFIPLTPKSSTEYSTIDDDTIAKQQLISGSYSTYNLDLGENKMLYYSSADNKMYKSFYFYTPEHTFGGDLSENKVPANKSEILNASQHSNKRPIYTKLSGYLVDEKGTSYEVCYNIYLGGNSTNNFDHFRNNIYKNYIRINGAKNGPDVDHRVEKLEKMDDIVEDVSREGQSANCYIICTEGTYMLPAYRGAYTNLQEATMCDVGEDVVLACDNPNITITIDHEKSKQSTIIFNVINHSDLLSGNAVIARLNSQGQVDWSWHLWFIPGIEWNAGSNSDLGSTQRIGGLSDKKMHDGTNMADRNLGVNASLYDLKSWMPGTIPGTYYKYGYRNPYFQNQLNNNGSDYYGFNEDDYTAWNSSVKAKTDPCPPGYRVPPISVWEGENAKNVTGEYYSGMFGIAVNAFRYWDNGTRGVTDADDDLYITDDIYYPCTSSGSSMSASHLEFMLKDITEDGDKTPVKGEEGGSWGSYWRNVTFTRTVYSDFKYTVPVTSLNTGGEMLAQSSDVVFQFKMGSSTKNNVKNNSRFISCTRKTYSVKIRQERSSVLTSWNDKDIISSIEISSEQLETEPSMKTKWKEHAADERFPNTVLSNASRNIGGASTTATLNKNQGYQIRCVKE